MPPLSSGKSGSSPSQPLQGQSQFLNQELFSLFIEADHVSLQQGLNGLPPSGGFFQVTKNKSGPVPKTELLCLACGVSVKPLQGMSRQVAITKCGENPVHKPGEPVVQLVGGVRGGVEEVLQAGASVCVQLDQEVGEVKGIALIGASIVRSGRLAVVV